MQAFIQEEQDFDSIDLIKYLSFSRYWAWLITLIVILVASGAYFVSIHFTPFCQTKTTVLVAMAPSNSSIDYCSLLLSSQRIQTNAQMLTKTPVLDEVASLLSLRNVDNGTVTAKPVMNTQLINIFAKSNDRLIAANIANTLASVFSEQVSALQTAPFSALEQNLLTQMTDVENKIKAADGQLSITTASTEMDRLETTIASYNQTYSGLVRSYEQVRLAEAPTVSNIVQIEPANTPTVPVRPKTVQNIVAAALLSVILACGLIIAINLLNDPVMTSDEIGKKLGLTMLGVIAHHKNIICRI